MTLWQRVWTKIEVQPSGCWFWTGALSHKRRGQKRPEIFLRREAGKVKIGSVARIVCEWFHGPPANSLYEAGHICPEGEQCLCIHPDHLRWMTRVENEQYKVRSS